MNEAELQEQLNTARAEAEALRVELAEAEAALQNQEPTYCHIRCAKHVKAVSPYDEGEECGICLWEQRKSLRTLGDGLAVGLEKFHQGKGMAIPQPLMQSWIDGSLAALTAWRAAQPEPEPAKGDTALIDAVGIGSWDITFDHHCGGFTVWHRGKMLAHHDLLRAAIRAAMTDGAKGGE